MLDHARPRPLESPLLRSVTATTPIRHGFFGREGGVSKGLYAGLNVGFGSHDDRDDITENRRRVCAWFGAEPEHLVTVHQVHSPDVHVVTGPLSGERPKADAMVTDRPGLVLGVLTADCGPILFADPQAGVVAAAHAGWRGAFDGVVASTIEAMVALGARPGRIVAALGPSISRHSYEVGPEFVARFVERDAGFRRYFAASDKPDHALFDLPAFTLERLSEAGVRAENLDICTYPDAGRFFSYRRATHRGEPDYGRQISAIAMTE